MIVFSFLAWTGCDMNRRPERTGQSSAAVGPYTPPEETYNPSRRPADAVTFVKQECGEDFHEAEAGACVGNAVGSVHYKDGMKCEVAAAITKPTAAGQTCCIKCNRSMDTAFHNRLDMAGATNVQIAPLVVQNGNSFGVAGEWTNVASPEVVFQAIRTRAGIGIGANPQALANNTGAIEYLETSLVLNEGGKRTTFGFFFRFTKGGQTREYFTLFSYDAVGNARATELFLFGPITRGCNGRPTANNPALLQGLAVADPAANRPDFSPLLDEVPSNVALVKNYVGDAPADETVKPGVHQANQGCRRCHATGDIPDATNPFPWGGNPPNPVDEQGISDCTGGGGAGTTGVGGAGGDGGDSSSGGAGGTASGGAGGAGGELNNGGSGGVSGGAGGAGGQSNSAGGGGAAAGSGGDPSGTGGSLGVGGQASEGGGNPASTGAGGMGGAPSGSGASGGSGGFGGEGGGGPCTQTSCDDGNPCNGQETCDAATGACEPGTPVICDDGDLCNGFEWCDSWSGACQSGMPVSCDDGDLCNGVEVCTPSTGGCLSGAPLSCDDGDPSNGPEVCDPASGCVSTGSPPGDEGNKLPPPPPTSTLPF